MKVTKAIRLPAFVEKLASKHGVGKDEVEDLLFHDAPRFFFSKKGITPGQDIDMASGISEAGRRLLVFFIDKTHGAARCTWCAALRAPL